MDLSKLSLGDKIIGAAGILLFISSFLDWFTIDLDFGFGVDGGSVGANGWDVGFFWCGIPVILGLLMIAVVAVKAFSPDTKLPDLPIGWGQALFIAGCVAAAIVLLKLLVGEDPSEIVERSIGLFIATVAAIGLAVGGFFKWQEEKTGGGPAPAAGGGTAPF